MSITFPDNDNRENRMNELASDINSSIITQSNMAADIDTKITDLSKIAQDMIKAIEPGLDVKVDTISLYKTTWEVANIVTPALTFTLAYKTLSKAIAARMLENAAEEAGEEGGEIAGEMVGEAAEELAIPTGAKLLAGAGGLVLSVGIGFAVDAIDGAIARGKLRDKIHELVPARVTQKINELQVAKLQEEVGSMLDAYKMMQQIGYTKDQMEQYVELTISKFKPELEQITADTAKQQLALLDSGRGSWTNEDMGD